MSNGLLLKLVTNSTFTKKENHWVIPCQMIKRLPCDPSSISSFLEIWLSMRNENAENLRSFAQLVLKILLFENWQVRQIFWLRWGKWDMDFWIMDNKDSYYDLVKLAKFVVSSITTDLHTKSTDCHQYLQCSSTHPDHLNSSIIINSIIYLHLWKRFSDACTRYEIMV